jgi:hypothetical protein
LASQLLDEFRERYDLLLVDVTDLDRNRNPVDGVTVADLADPDRSKYASLFEGVDAVVHLGYRNPDRITGANVTPIDRYDIEASNVQMANNVYRSAYDAGVKRVVMASSNHAADWYEHALVHDKQMEMVSPDLVPVSDNFYGWAKASYELLGHPYATGIFGRKLEVVHIRIGAPRDVSGSRYEDESAGKETGGPGLQEFKRDLGAHLSERDLRQLVRKSIDTPNIENQHGVPWLVVYGISGNTRAFWSLESARRVLGYDPEDDSEVKYAADIRRLLTGPDASIGGGRVGG